MDERFADNVPGRFGVDEGCTCCGMCGVLADDHFRPSEEGPWYVVHRQPGTPDELARCLDAVEACPVDAIRDQPGITTV